MFAPGYNLSSNVHAFAAAKERMLAKKNPEFAIIGLLEGVFHVTMMNGTAAITAAITDSTSAHLAPFESQRMTHITTSTAIIESNDDHPIFPL